MRTTADSNGRRNVTTGMSKITKSSLEQDSCGENELSATTDIGMQQDSPTVDSKPTSASCTGRRYMTAHHLKKTVALLQVRPRRLVAQGVAPRRVLGDETVTENSIKDLQETLEPDETEPGSTDLECMEVTDDSSTDSCNDVEKQERNVLAENVLDDEEQSLTLAIEIIPLLRALDMTPDHLVLLELVDREALRALPGETRRHRHAHALQERVRGCGSRWPHDPRSGRMAHGGPHFPPPPPHDRGHHRTPTHSESGEERVHGPRGRGHHGPGHIGPLHCRRFHGPPSSSPCSRGPGPHCGLMKSDGPSSRRNRRSFDGCHDGGPRRGVVRVESSDEDMHGPRPYGRPYSRAPSSCSWRPEGARRW